MGRSISNQLLSSNSLVLSFRHSAGVRLGAKETVSKAAGDLRFRLDNGGSFVRQCTCARSGFVAESVTRGKVRSGNIGVSGIEGPGLLRRIGRRRWRLCAQLRGKLFYRALEESVETRVSGTDLLVSEGEVCEGHLEVVLIEDVVGDWNRLLVASGQLEFTVSRKLRGLIDEFSVLLEGAVVWLWPRLRGSVKADTSETCRELRHIRLRPVGFYASQETKDQHTANLWSRQFEAARDLWKRCCIDIREETPHLILDGTMMGSTSIETIRDQWTDPEIEIVEVFFVDSNLGGGGGWTHKPGTGTDKIVLTKRATNKFLLAHELGHVFGGFHPCACPNPGGGCDCPEETWQWLGDNQTILEPSNDLHVNNESKILPKYCTFAYNPQLLSSGEECCFSVDA